MRNRGWLPVHGSPPAFVAASAAISTPGRHPAQGAPPVRQVTGEGREQAVLLTPREHALAGLVADRRRQVIDLRGQEGLVEGQPHP